MGIGIGKRHHEASILDGQGSLHGKCLCFANTHTGFGRLLEVVRKTAGKDEFVFGMEATGHSWLALYTHLQNVIYEAVKTESNADVANEVIYGCEQAAQTENNLDWVKATMRRLEDRVPFEAIKKI